MPIFDMLRDIQRFIEIGFVQILSTGLSTAISTDSENPTVIPIDSTIYGHGFFSDPNDHLKYEEHAFVNPIIEGTGFIQFYNTSNQARFLTMGLEVSPDNGETWIAQTPFEGVIPALTGERNGFQSVTMNFKREISSYPFGALIRWTCYSDATGVCLKTVDISIASQVLM